MILALWSLWHILLTSDVSDTILKGEILAKSKPWLICWSKDTGQLEHTRPLRILFRLISSWPGYVSAGIEPRWHSNLQSYRPIDCHLHQRTPNDSSGAAVAPSHTYTNGHHLLTPLIYYLHQGVAPADPSHVLLTPRCSTCWPLSCTTYTKV